MTKEYFNDFLLKLVHLSYGKFEIAHTVCKIELIKNILNNIKVDFRVH